MPAPPWQDCGWVRLSLGFREPSVHPEKIPQEVTPNHKDAGPAWIYHRRGKTLSPWWWIRVLFPYRSVSEVPPRAIPWWWNDPLSAGLQASWETLPLFTRLRQHGPASLFPWQMSFPSAPATWRSWNLFDGSDITQIQHLSPSTSVLC